MPRHHYSNRAILILENPWELDGGDCNRSSVLPFVEGIAKLAGDTEVFHANFYDKRSFDRALEILCSPRFNNAVIYIAAHGSKSKVGGVKLEDILFEIGDHSKSTNITGIMLGACFAGTDTDRIEVFMQGTNVKWCAGYASSCEWLPATMIDCSIMASMLELDEDELSDRETMIEQLAHALAPFSRTYVIGEDADDNLMTLEESIRVVMQPSGRGNRARHVTEEVLEERDKLQEFA
ncbi:TPA: hypothetical protein ACQT3E_002137 [Pseudomonas aeruginosa]|uniref:hypothetical protein n=1 Tax=Pseudomonas TaxID=286 RepID=UPI001A360651|nr:hypothetical protein [Pseudomonas aeruginosa]MBH3537649.1 hypothetical protein [Pseudomonas aeruginosa]MBX6553206.1 hypothetical protein [Pseudomonas aeruginosa]MBX6585276.1 hypothetical protein [Pseudomonas aeruginosa]MBX6615414.1 hypothetical protein [Pseudomonas aeruginosa]MBX6878705.1 hypothetical protein [Pseudomonas aeruginosa]